jgi:hypothetical protein
MNLINIICIAAAVFLAVNYQKIENEISRFVEIAE